MQIHLNGFHDGDPELHAAAPGYDAASRAMPEQLDVLIVGSGPAGLTLAAQLAAFPEITTRIVEQKDGPMRRGQADGISCRSMEMFNAFGFADRVAREGYQVNEVTFWMPDAAHPEQITRVGRVQDVEDGLSEMPHVILNQARVHDLFLDVMRRSPTRLEVDYQRRLIDLQVDPQARDYPVTVKLEHGGSAPEIETVRARYVVGCDGARSAVRTAIGRELKGDYAYQSWGVMDVLADTDFPDIRMKSIVKSADSGNVLIIPREGGYLVRIYVELSSIDAPGESRGTTLAQVVSAAKRIFHPYRFEVREVGWWSVYEIGHSLTDKFDDVPASDTGSRLPCVFIAGDACHTHSAKAGQGMNVSMGDTFNLGWKLISVLNRRSPPELLHSYSAERQAVAQALIDFDHRWSRIMSAPAEVACGDDTTPLVQRHFIAGGEFTAGLSVRYPPSTLTGASTWQGLAAGFEIGARFHSAPVVRLCDAKPMHLGHCIQADARWHLFAFAGAGAPAAAASAIDRLCNFLADSPASPVRRYTPCGDDPDSVISTCAVFQQDRCDLDLTGVHDFLKPCKGRFQVRDYENIFCAGPDQDIFDARGIDRERGALVIVRPDQYVAHVLPLDAYDELSRFFGSILLEPVREPGGPQQIFNT